MLSLFLREHTKNAIYDAIQLGTLGEIWAEILSDRKFKIWILVTLHILNVLFCIKSMSLPQERIDKNCQPWM